MDLWAEFCPQIHVILFSNTKNMNWTVSIPASKQCHDPVTVALCSLVAIIHQSTRCPQTSIPVLWRLNRVGEMLPVYLSYFMYILLCYASLYHPGLNTPVFVSDRLCCCHLIVLLIQSLWLWAYWINKRTVFLGFCFFVCPVFFLLCPQRAFPSTPALHQPR